MMDLLRGQKGRDGWTHALSWCLDAQECVGSWARSGEEGEEAQTGGSSGNRIPGH